MNTDVIVNSIISNMMESIIEKVTNKDPFVFDVFKAEKPLYATLVPQNIWVCSHFERRFVTPFGHAWEKLALAVGEPLHGICVSQKKITGTIRKSRLTAIERVLSKYNSKDKKIKPNWERDLKQILKCQSGKLYPVDVICDVYIESSLTNKKYAFELKAPLPNIDQTRASKEKLLKLLAMEEHPVDYAYFGLTYNPYGSKDNYQWPLPFTHFDMQNDSCVLIGSELWNLIGGDGTYEHFINEINKLGANYRSIIERYLKDKFTWDNQDDIL